ncbi:MAG TPA: L,D-transpeptidase family protein, partial [Tissierellaceae bacterium]|nr:L,D-transpeptidase family protein [Tissierellaceae bacterium]
VIKIIDRLDYMNASSKSKKPKLTILIEVQEKRLSLIDREDEKILDTYTIATGKSSNPTPLGSFRIIEKAHWGEGFGSRWLGLDVPWGIYGIHGTNQPSSIGGSVSAGCVRMRNSDVEDLYDKVSADTQVVIMNGLYGPFGHGFRTLKPGDRGADVLEVQKRLSLEGYYKDSLDGIYGEAMKKSLIDFLRSKDFPLTDKIDEDIYNELGIVLMD